MIEVSFVVPTELGPALRSAVEKLQADLARSAEGMHPYAREGAITRALSSLGPLRAALNAVVPHPDPVKLP